MIKRLIAPREIHFLFQAGADIFEFREQMIEGGIGLGDISLDHLLSKLENIGASLEEEMDLARRDESFDNRRNSGGDM